MPNYKEEMKKVYQTPQIDVYSVQTEAIMVVNSGQTGGTVPGMGWGDNGGNTGGSIPGMGWGAAESRSNDWDNYEN